MADRSPFVGVWKLVSWEVAQPDGAIQYLFGRNVVGYLMYTADGYMSAQIMDPDRRQSDPNFPLENAGAQTLSDPDRARAYTTYLAYCGSYTVEADRVVHHVKAALIPSWTGSEQARPFRFDDGLLVIGAGAHKLTWRRAVEHA